MFAFRFKTKLLQLMELNWIAVALTALVPMVVGFVYYHPQVLGGPWMRANGLTPESIGNGPKPI